MLFCEKIFCENYAKLYFDAKHLERDWIGGEEIFGTLFFEKKNLFLPISDTALIFRLGADTGIVSLLFTFHSNLYIFEIIFYSIAMKLLHLNT